MSLYLLHIHENQDTLEQAEIILERAQQLDPYFKPTRMLRLKVARKRKDQDKTARIWMEIEELSDKFSGQTGWNR